MNYLLRTFALLPLLGGAAASAQTAYPGLMNRTPSLERCTSASESGCDSGFVRVTWPAPIPNSCGRPAFLPELLPKGFVGTTGIQMLIDSAGAIADVKVTNSSGQAELDNALLAAARTCQFVPGTRGGFPATLPTLWFYRWEQSPSPATAVRVAPPRPGRPMNTVARPSCPSPDYPMAAIRVEAQGEVRVRLKFDQEGNVSDAELMASAGDSRAHKLLDKVALEAFRQCKLESPSGSSPREIVLGYVFKLTDEPAPAMQGTSAASSPSGRSQ